jgi:hypothetical protein
MEVFEEAVLGLLREIAPSDLFPQNGHADEVIGLSGELASVKAEIAAIQADIDERYSAELSKALRRKEERQEVVARLLAEAQAQQANPPAESWGEAQSLMAAVQNPEAKMLLRAVLRRVVDSIQLLVVPRGKDRLAWCQVCFNAGNTVKRRDFLILHRPPRANASGRTEGCVKVESAPNLKAPIDLRKVDDAKRLESYLLDEDLDTLCAGMKDLANSER